LAGPAGEKLNPTDRWISPAAPSSCVESFTDAICGLPGVRNGCRRQAAVNNDGVPPLERPTDERFWVVFKRSQDAVTAKLTAERVVTPAVSDADAEALFAFADQPESNDARPEYYMFRRSGHDVAVPAWIRETEPANGEADLRSLFGPATFAPLDVKNAHGLRLRWSIADLVNATLDGLCKYRRSGTSLGISTCRAEQTLANEGYLTNTTIRFSFVHPGELESKFLPTVIFGANTRLDDTVIKRLSLAGDGIGRRASYLTVFSPHTREAILPDEVDRSYLQFPIEEISSYLLHWLLIRLLSNQRSPFARQWRAWAAAVTPAERQTRFRELLGLEIKPAHDPYTFSSAKTGTASPEVRGHFARKLSFSTALEDIGLGSPGVVQKTAQFIANEFGDDPTRAARGFRQLPMYRQLGWRATQELRDLVEANASTEQLLEGIHRAMACADFSNLEEHVGRSVFPIGEFLLQWPGHEFADYLILPLWEDDIAGERRPVIFAHVFTTYHASTFGSNLQNVLLPVAASCAHEYYAAIKNSVAQLEHAERDASSQILLMSAIAHSAGNALRLANGDRLAARFSEDEPPTRLRPELQAALPDGFLDAVRNLWIGSRMVSFLVAMVELSAKSEPLRTKFQAEGVYTLSECISTAAEMVKAYASAIEHVAPLKLQYDDFNDIVLPAGYVSSIYVQTLLFEILLNVAKYGATEADGKFSAAAVQLSVELDEGGAFVYIVNPLTAADAQSEWLTINGVAKLVRKSGGAYGKATFLDFAHGLSRRFGGIDVSSCLLTDGNDVYYQTKLHLGALEIVDIGGAKHRVVPEAMRLTKEE